MWSEELKRRKARLHFQITVQIRGSTLFVLKEKMRANNQNEAQSLNAQSSSHEASASNSCQERNRGDHDAASREQE